nr:hypothetical protein [Comamonas testosteroni]
MKNTENTMAPAIDAAQPPQGRLRRFWNWLSALLQRAERRVGENFRVPPNGQ